MFELTSDGIAVISSTKLFQSAGLLNMKIITNQYVEKVKDKMSDRFVIKGEKQSINGGFISLNDINISTMIGSILAKAKTQWMFLFFIPSKPRAFSQIEFFFFFTLKFLINAMFFFEDISHVVKTRL